QFYQSLLENITLPIFDFFDAPCDELHNLQLIFSAQRLVREALGIDRWHAGEEEPGKRYDITETFHARFDQRHDLTQCICSQCPLRITLQEFFIAQGFTQITT